MVSISPVGSYEEVFQFQITVEDALFMEILKPEDRAGRKEAGVILWEAEVCAVFHDIVEQLASEHGVHQHVQASIVLRDANDGHQLNRQARPRIRAGWRAGEHREQAASRESF